MQFIDSCGMVSLLLGVPSTCRGKLQFSLGDTSLIAYSICQHSELRCLDFFISLIKGQILQVDNSEQCFGFG